MATKLFAVLIIGMFLGASVSMLGFEKTKEGCLEVLRTVQKGVMAK